MFKVFFFMRDKPKHRNNDDFLKIHFLYTNLVKKFDLNLFILRFLCKKNSSTVFAIRLSSINEVEK